MEVSRSSIFGGIALYFSVFPAFVVEHVSPRGIILVEVEVSRGSCCRSCSSLFATSSPLLDPTMPHAIQDETGNAGDGGSEAGAVAAPAPLIPHAVNDGNKSEQVGAAAGKSPTSYVHMAVEKELRPAELLMEKELQNRGEECDPNNHADADADAVKGIIQEAEEFENSKKRSRGESDDTAADALSAKGKEIIVEARGDMYNSKEEAKTDNAATDDIIIMREKTKKGDSTKPTQKEVERTSNTTPKQSDAKTLAGNTHGTYYAVRVGYAVASVVSDDEDGDDISPPNKKRKHYEQSCAAANATPTPRVTIRSAIFLYWEDARQFVDNIESSTGHNAEYAAFNSFEQAEEYIVEAERGTEKCAVRAAEWASLRSGVPPNRSPSRKKKSPAKLADKLTERKEPPETQSRPKRTAACDKVQEKKPVPEKQSRPKRTAARGKVQDKRSRPSVQVQEMRAASDGKLEREKPLPNNVMGVPPFGFPAAAPFMMNPFNNIFGGGAFGFGGGMPGMVPGIVPGMIPGMMAPGMVPFSQTSVNINSTSSNGGGPSELNPNYVELPKRIFTQEEKEMKKVQHREKHWGEQLSYHLFAPSLSYNYTNLLSNNPMP